VDDTNMIIGYFGLALPKNKAALLLAIEFRFMDEAMTNI
jgi:hypothetical protein